MNEGETLAQRHSEMVDKLERCGPGATLGTVDDDEVRIVASRHHRFADRQEFPRVADAQLEANRLSAREPPQRGDEGHELDWRRERRVLRRRNAVLAERNSARERDLAADLGGRQYAAVAGLRALAQFQLDHLDLIVGGGLDEPIDAEHALAVAAAEVA